MNEAKIREKQGRDGCFDGDEVGKWEGNWEISSSHRVASAPCRIGNWQASGGTDSPLNMTHSS